MLADRDQDRRVAGSVRATLPATGFALTPGLDPEESNDRHRYRHCPNHVVLLQFAARATRERLRRAQVTYQQQPRFDRSGSA